MDLTENAGFSPKNDRLRRRPAPLVIMHRNPHHTMISSDFSLTGLIAAFSAAVDTGNDAAELPSLLAKVQPRQIWI